MANDFTALKAAIAKVQGDLDKLKVDVAAALASPAPSDQPTIDAITSSIDSISSGLEALDASLPAAPAAPAAG